MTDGEKTISHRNYKDIWNNCLRFIEDNIDANAYTNWFLPIVPIALNQNTLTIQVPSSSYYECLENNYYHLIKTAIKKELGVTGKLNYKVLLQKTNKSETDMTINLPSSPKHTIGNPGRLKPIDVYKTDNRDIPDPFILPGIQKRRIPTNLNSSMTFDNFIEGDCNRLVRSAGWAIAKQPGETAFNPLFIYSDAGLGKTHIANAIGNQTKEYYPDKVVVYVSADLFYQQFMEAIKNNNRDDFLYFYQSVDMLIIDDIQFLGTGNKEKTQEALFHIFNDLQRKHKQLIICSDKSPVEISGFDQRLLSRFKWGLTADLQVPDLETRVAILNNKLENNGVVFPDEIINYLALRVTSNTREMEGAMIAILAQASLNRRKITEELAKEMIDKYVKSTAKEISIEYIQKVVCDYFEISIDKINANTRKREIVQARQFCMYFAKKYTKMPLSTIGKFCGDKDHATVLHSCRVIENLLETDKNIRAYYEDIEKKMKM